MAETYIKKAEIDESYANQAYELTIKATEFWNLAAKKLGFRNIQDMYEYTERYGHF